MQGLEVVPHVPSEKHLRLGEPVKSARQIPETVVSATDCGHDALSWTTWGQRISIKARRELGWRSKKKIRTLACAGDGTPGAARRALALGHAAVSGDAGSLGG